MPPQFVIASSGGPFAVHDGAWGAIAAVQTPGARALSVGLTPDNTVLVSWPASAEGWMLEVTNPLPDNAAIPRSVIPPPHQTNGSNLHLVEPVPVGNKFYRLRKP